ncbi:unnamed protein product [Phytophthora fragariaefolia]|uniref:Unnamed protein product n=1 Tax=Phytophthora fragariaefolia TaxID=1490495 RepID=A0A9W6TKN9_9STRA|nr:unnamed protein product [Phytophthora fragariaefolia]
MNSEKAALVVVDDYSRFTTVYPLKSKEAPAVNAAMKRYIAWVEGQFTDCKVLTIVSDNGLELNNDDMKECAPNIGTHAQDYDEYGGSANVISDVCIANGYIHPKPLLSQLDQGYTKMDNNCRIGFIVGYLEGQAGCQVYFPTEPTVQHVNNVSVNEDIVYKDRYHDEYQPTVSDWLSRIDHPDDEVCEDGDEHEQSDDEVRDCEGEVGIEEWANMPMHMAFPGSLPAEPTPQGDQTRTEQKSDSEEGPTDNQVREADQGAAFEWEANPVEAKNSLAHKPREVTSVDAYTTGNLSDSEAEYIITVENQEKNNENVMLEEEGPGGPRDVEHIPAEPELATTKEEDDELAEADAPEHAIVAIDAGNGMDTCMIPEHLTGVQRFSLEAELEDIQDIKRQRGSEGQPRKMILRS